MKISIDRNHLLDALQKIQSVVEKKNTVQILGNILCSARENTLSLYGTDLEVGIKVVAQAKTDQVGDVTVSAKSFYEIVKELPQGQLTLTKKENNWVEILSGKIRFNIVSLPADEYPSLPHFEEKSYIESRVDALSAMIDKTVFAVSTDATRYHLNGVFFEFKESNILRMTATDGHRLSFVENEVFQKTIDMKRGIIVPRKGLSELQKLLEQTSATSIGLAFEKGYIYARFDSTFLFVRLIEGEYPDVQQVIPKDFGTTVHLPKEVFLAALKRVSLLAHEKSKGVKFQMKPNLLVITSSNPDMGDACEEIEIDYSGAETEVGFNARYLLDCLPVIESEEISFSFKDRLSPGVLEGKGIKNHTYVVMPMRI